MTERWGLIKRKECWSLTSRGWLALLIIFCTSAYIFSRTVYGFLSVHKPIDAQALVIESWIPDFAVVALLAEVDLEEYDLILAAGGRPLKGAYLSDYATTADQLAATLIAVGVDSQMINVIRDPAVTKDRTYSTAVEVDHWLKEYQPQVKTLNVVTIGPHARRSRLLFDLALTTNVSVGVINLKDNSYSSRYWWKSSIGLKTVLGELLAYFYAKLIFYP